MNRNLNPGYQGYEGGVLQFDRQVNTRVTWHVKKDLYMSNVNRVQCRLLEPFDQEFGEREREREIRKNAFSYNKENSNWFLHLG